MTEPVGGESAPSFFDVLGSRAARRAEPRASIAVAGAGCVLAVLGALIVSGDTGTSGGDFNRVPGLVLSALVVAAGFAALASLPRGAVGAAGTVAAALGVPPFMLFLTWDANGLPPYSTEAILIVSTLAWLGAWAIGPGRGRPFFLGAGLIALWFTILQVTEQVFDAPYVLIGGIADSFMGFQSTSALNGSYDSSGSYSGDYGSAISGPSLGRTRLDLPDPTTVGLICIGFGVAYLLMCRWLDHGGRHGIATPFAFATLPTLFAGVAFLSDDLEQAGTGFLLVAIGLVLAHHGSKVGRRATAWIGGVAVAVGMATFLADMTDDATIGGMLFVAGGIALVALGHGLAVALDEPDEMAVTGDVLALSVPAVVPPDVPPPPPVGDDTGEETPPPPDPPPPT